MLIYSKRFKESIGQGGSNHRKKLDPSDYVIIENAHETIISKKEMEVRESFIDFRTRTSSTLLLPKICI
ncbi:hypothetical protein, partial [Geobacillus stearothermophilus]|uniref:hypothetical protein n=1 Tax=Geobacillus stearothermophilus TaxID=1422 RepID=UPI003D2234C2